MPPLQGATKVWDGGAVADDDWSSGLNWSPNGAPVAGDALVFPAPLPVGDTNTLNDLVANTIFQTISLAEGYRLSGNAIGLSGGLAAIDQGTLAAQVDLSITLQGAQTFAAEPDATLGLGATGGLRLNGHNISLSAVAATSVITVEGVVRDGGNVSCIGDGLVDLRGANLYTGTTSIGSTVRAGSATALGSTAGATTLNGTLRLSAASGTVFAEPLTFRGGGVLGTLGAQVGAAYTWSGAMTLPLAVIGSPLRTVDIPGSDGLLVTGSLEGIATLVKTGTGTLTIRHTNETLYTGPLRVERGTMILDRPASLASDVSGTTTIGTVAGNDSVVEASLRLLGGEQLSDSAMVEIHPNGQLVFLEGTETIGMLVLHPSQIAGVVAANLDELAVTTGISMAGAGSAAIFAPVRAVGSNLPCTVETGTLILNHALLGAPGTSFRKLGSGTLSLINVGPDGAEPLPLFEAVEGTLRVVGDSIGTSFRLAGVAAELTGFGTVADIVGTVAGGELQPAVNLALNCENLELDPANTLRVTLQNEIAPGFPSFSRLRVAGGVSLGGAELILDHPDFSPQPGDAFPIIENLGSTSVQGTFAGLPEGAEFTDDGKSFRITYQGGDGNDVVLVHFITPTGTTRRWTGNGADSEWTTPNNWQGNTAPEPGDDLLFPLGAVRLVNTNDFPARTGFNSLRFESGGYVIEGNALTLNEGIVFAQPTGTVSLEVELGLSNRQTFSVDGAARAEFPQALNLSDHTLTFHCADAAGEIAFAGEIGGAGTVVKSGPGRMLMEAANSFTGFFDLQSGVLVASENVFGDPTNRVAIRTGSTLRLESPQALVIPHVISLRGTLESVGDHSLVGPLSTEATAIIDVSAQPLVLQGAVTSPEGLTKSGTGTLEISGAEANVLNDLAVAQGTVLLSKPSGVNALSGDVTVGSATNNATLQLGAPHQIADTALVRINTLSLLDAGAHDETVGGLVLFGGTASTGAGTLTLAGGIATEPSGLSSTISGNLRFAAAGPHVLEIAEGPAADDLAVSAAVTVASGASLTRQGEGRAVLGGTGVLRGITLLAGSTFFNGTNTTTTVILDGGTAGGHGTVSGLFGDSGVVAPGTSPGRLTVTDSGSIGSGVTLRVEINGPLAATDFDQLAVQNPGNLTGSLQIVAGSGFVPTLGQIFRIVDCTGAGSFRGIFAGLPEGAFLADGDGGYRISYSGGDGNDVVLTRAATPPAEAPAVVTGFTLGAADPGGIRPVTLSATGVPGASYFLEVGSDLVAWQVSGPTLTADAITGALAFNLTTNPTSEPVLFYRVRRL